MARQKSAEAISVASHATQGPNRKAIPDRNIRCPQNLPNNRLERRSNLGAKGAELLGLGDMRRKRTRHAKNNPGNRRR